MKTGLNPNNINSSRCFINLSSRQWLTRREASAAREASFFRCSLWRILQSRPLSHTHTHKHSLALSHTHTHTHSRTHTHSHTCTDTHTNTHTGSLRSSKSQRRVWLSIWVCWEGYWRTSQTQTPFARLIFHITEPALLRSHSDHQHKRRWPASNTS